MASASKLVGGFGKPIHSVFAAGAIGKQPVLRQPYKAAGCDYWRDTVLHRAGEIRVARPGRNYIRGNVCLISSRTFHSSSTLLWDALANLATRPGLTMIHLAIQSRILRGKSSQDAGKNGNWYMRFAYLDRNSPNNGNKNNDFRIVVSTCIAHLRLSRPAWIY